MSTFSDLLKSYSNKSQPHYCLQPNTKLDGSTVKQKLEKLFLKRKTLTASPLCQEDESKQDTIAICLLIIDKLHHEDIWRYWFENAKGKGFHFELIVHAKYPKRIQSDWLKSHTISKSFSPEWNSIEVVRAMLLLLSEGLKSKSIGRFVFGTETCLPIHSPEHIWSELFKDNLSWLNARHSFESKWEAANCFHAVDSTIIPTHLNVVWKSLPGWIMLTRRHAQEIDCLHKCLGSDLVSAWGPSGSWTSYSGGVFAPEEIYFPTMLAILGYLKDPPTSLQTKVAPNKAAINQTIRYSHDEVKRQMVTYAEWARIGDANPIAYDKFTEKLIRDIRLTGALFARKFQPGSCSLVNWIHVMSLLDSSHSTTSIDNNIDKNEIREELSDNIKTSQKCIIDNSTTDIIKHNDDAKIIDIKSSNVNNTEQDCNNNNNHKIETPSIFSINASSIPLTNIQESSSVTTNTLLTTDGSSLVSTNINTASYFPIIDTIIIAKDEKIQIDKSSANFKEEDDDDDINKLNNDSIPKRRRIESNEIS